MGSAQHTRELDLWAESLILSPAKVSYRSSYCFQDSSERPYSPMILTNTRFRRRPSRLTGQPFRLASKHPLPGAKDFGELSRAVQAAVGHCDHHFAAHHAQHLVAFRFRCASAACPFVQDRGLPQASLAGAVVQPASRPALAGRCVRCQPLQPLFVVRAQAPLVVIDEDAGSDVRQYSTLRGIY